MTAKKRKTIDDALRALFRQREQSEACARLADLLRSLPADPVR